MSHCKLHVNPLRALWPNVEFGRVCKYSLGLACFLAISGLISSLPFPSLTFASFQNEENDLANQFTQSVLKGEIDTTLTLLSNSAYEQTIGDAPGMDVYSWYNQDFCWVHTFSVIGIHITSAKLELRAWDVDYGEGAEQEHDVIYVDGSRIGELVGSDDEWSITTFNLDLAAISQMLSDGKLNVCIDIDSTHNYNNWAVTIDWSKLTIEYTSGGIISGRVVDAITGQGISGAMLLLDPDPLTYCPMTDSEGNFSFSVPPGVYNLTARAAGYKDDIRTGITVTLGETVEVNFALIAFELVTVNKDNTYLYDQDSNDNPNPNRKIKKLPAGWVLRRFKESGHPLERSPDGIRWFNKVEDVTDGVIGWVERGDLNAGGDGTRFRFILFKDNHPNGFTFTRDLSKGNTGDDVRLLQAILLKQGFLSSADHRVTGYFGEETKKAAVKFQLAYGIITSETDEGAGCVGPKTRAKLNELMQDATFLERLSNDYDLEHGRAMVIRDEAEEHLPGFLPTAFPLGVVLAIAIQESSCADFDNEIAALTPWGRGIMQIETDDFVGKGSGIEFYPDGVNKNTCRNSSCIESFLHPSCQSNICYAPDCRHYYTNTIQGIEANVKDGLQALKDHYKESGCVITGCSESIGSGIKVTGSCIGGQLNIATITKVTPDGAVEWEMSCPTEFKIIDTVWRYNSRSTKEIISECTRYDYLRCVADRFDSLQGSFGYDMPNSTRWKTLFYAVRNARHEFIKIKSPVEIQVIDSAGRVTTLSEAEIPFSSYHELEEAIVIPFSYDHYRYRVLGTAEGNYGLTITLVENGESRVFTAVDIPTAGGTVHEYTIDWDLLSQGNEGVTIQIDQDGDGIFERTIQSDSELTWEEFEATLFTDDLEPSPLPGWQTAGLWHLADNTPCATPGYSSPTHAFYYGDDGTCSYSGNGILTSPQIALPEGTKRVLLSFDYFLQKSRSDIANVQISFNGGRSWSNVRWYNRSPTQGSWVSTGEIPLVVPRGATSVMVRFSFTTRRGSTGGVGWLIDNISLAVPPPLRIIDEALPTATLGQPYRHTMTAQGGTPPYTWGARGLPAGLRMNARTGLISGTPRKTGNYTVAITVRDRDGNRVSQNYTLIVLPVSGALGVEPLQVYSLTAAPIPAREAVKFIAEGTGIKEIGVEIFNLAGARVFNSGWVENGLSWGLKNDRGQPVANGVYLYVVRVRGYDGREYVSEVRKLVILR